MESTGRHRPSGYSSIALLGITGNAALIIFAAYNAYYFSRVIAFQWSDTRWQGNILFISTLSLIEIESLFCIAASLLLLIGSLALLFRQKWARRLCVVGLVAFIVFYIVGIPILLSLVFIVSKSIALRPLIYAGIGVGIITAKILVFQYLRSQPVKNYLCVGGNTSH